MTGQRNGVVRVGDEIRLRAAVYTIASLSDGSIRLIDAVGNRSQIPLPKLLGDPSLEVLAGVRPRLSSAELLEDVPEEVAERARWWERHLLEVLTGRRPDAPRECPPRPEFDPASRSLRQRELAKLAELHATGHEFTLITLQRQRFRYQRSGLMGVVDGRYRPHRPVLGRVDDRIVAVIRRLVDEETDMSTGTVSRLRRKTEKALRAEYGEAAPKMPSQATFYRLVNRLAEGRHTFGSADTQVAG